jgi:tetratricopeptide (TPR) repeat protein
LVLHEALEDGQEKAAESAALRVGRLQPVLDQEAKEKLLNQVFGAVGRMPFGPQVMVNGLPAFFRAIMASASTTTFMGAAFMAQTRCPDAACAANLTVPDNLCGKRVQCPKCGTLFIAGSARTPPPGNIAPGPGAQGMERFVRKGPGGNEWQDGETVLEDFVVERRLGHGGMGAVYLVRSNSTGRRFAVKRALYSRDEDRRNFLAELQTWIGLPEHPHLVACRFFRTIGDEIAIFADLVDGGSLAEWIRRRKLPRLDQVLDVAIQFAWGLDAAHEAGLIHQDVKPGNVLMTADGSARVGDFGLARARARGGEHAGSAGDSILVSAGGMTLAYCSPEQHRGAPLSRRTDVFSFGVSVLEMFNGRVTWGSGENALKDGLEELLENGPDDTRLPPLPLPVAEVLRRCLREKPNERWASMAQVAEGLKNLYRKLVGKDYPRPVPAMRAAPAGIGMSHDRRSQWGARWDDPREWLIKALQAEGRDPAEADSLLPPRTGPRQAQVIADLAAYEAARQIYENLSAGGREDVESDLAMLCAEKALVHLSVDDMPGALTLYDRAIALYRRLVDQEGRRDLAEYLAWAYANRALALRQLGDLPGAAALCDRAIALYRRLVDQEGRRDLANSLAGACINKAVALEELGDPGGALALFDQAINILQRLVEQERRGELAGDLARAELNRANRPFRKLSILEL